MGIFSKKQTVFKTIQFEGDSKIYDYPKYLPTPQMSDIVRLNGKNGIVRHVIHSTQGNVSEIKIECFRED